MKTADLREKLLEKAMDHVVFDGWSQTTFAAAVADSGIDPTVARALFPRGGLDLACAYHRLGDEKMCHALSQSDLSALRYRDKIATAIWLRLSFAEPEAVRRGSSLFALPQNAIDGAKLIWGSADAIWTALGDTSKDSNWYSKRATLSAVYTACVLFWLGDDSPDKAATRAFIERRIEGVMQFEKTKAQLATNPLAKALMVAPNMILSRLHAPKPNSSLPGCYNTRQDTETKGKP